MALFVEIISGAEQGQKFKLVAGVRIGRTTGEIILSEPKMSALHAQVKSSENGKLYLVDSGSSNGIRINGERVQKVALMPGVVFRIGRTRFKVFEDSSREATHPSISVEEEGWLEYLKSHVPMLEVQNANPIMPVLPFTSLVELRFLEGIQTDQVITLGYGPRKAGSAVLDIELLDVAAPDVAFELQPLDDGRILFLTAHPELIMLNDRSLTSESLKSGDLIRVGTSLIEVRFVT